MDNTIKAYMNDKTGYSVTSPAVWVGDYGLMLVIEGLDLSELPGECQIDFADDPERGTAVTVPLESNCVEIPRELILSGKDIYAYLYVKCEDYGRTIHTFRIPNRLRPTRESVKSDV